MNSDDVAERITEPRKPNVERICCPSPCSKSGFARYEIQTSADLETLIKQTLDEDPQVRQGGFKGIGEHVGMKWLGLSKHTQNKAIMEKFCHGINDSDNGVRETTYDVLVKSKENVDIREYVPMLISSVSEALAHPEMDIHLTGRKVYEFLIKEILPSCYHLLLRKVFPSLQDIMENNDAHEEHGCNIRMLRMLQSANVCLSSMPSVDEIFFDGISLRVIKRILSTFPRDWNQDSHVGDPRDFAIDIEVVKMFLRLPKMSDTLQSEKFLAFINHTLHKITESNLEELLAFFPPHFPELVSKLPSHSQANLIQAFTVAFKRCDPKSKFKLACVSAIDEVLQLECNVLDVNGEMFRKCRRKWIKELFKLLQFIEKRTYYYSQVVWSALLKACSSGNLEGLENRILPSFRSLFCEPKEGPFRCCMFDNLSDEMKKESLKFLQYFPVLDEPLLKSMAYECARRGIGSLSEILSALNKFYETHQHVQADGLLHFFSLLVSEIEVYRGSDRRYSLLSESDADYMDVIIPTLTYNAEELSKFPPASNIHSQYAVLRLVSELDSSLAKSSPEFVAGLSNIIPSYMSNVLQAAIERPMRRPTGHRDCYLRPCFAILIDNTEFFGLVLDGFTKYLEDQRGHACLDNAIAVGELLALMRKDVGLNNAMLTLGDKLDSIKACLISFKASLDYDFENLPVEKYNKLCLVIQPMM